MKQLVERSRFAAKFIHLMHKAQQAKIDLLYQQHVNALRWQGKAVSSTIDAYSRALRRITEFFNRCPDKPSQAHLHPYFDALIKTHAWGTVKVDRNGLQFFYRHILNKDRRWVDIVKPPQTKVLPDILTLKEIERLINGTRALRYQTFIVAAFSMGLRLHETLKLKVGDIDTERMKVHIRLGKAKKDRFATLPQQALLALPSSVVAPANMGRSAYRVAPASEPSPVSTNPPRSGLNVKRVNCCR